MNTTVETVTREWHISVSFEWISKKSGEIMYFIFEFINWFVIDSSPKILKEIDFFTTQITVYPFGDIERRTPYLLLVEIIQKTYT